jgi:hypothetical protein
MTAKKSEVYLLGLYQPNYFYPSDPPNLLVNFVLFKFTNLNTNHINLMNATKQCIAKICH